MTPLGSETVPVRLPTLVCASAETVNRLSASTAKINLLIIVSSFKMCGPSPVRLMKDLKLIVSARRVCASGETFDRVAAFSGGPISKAHTDDTSGRCLSQSYDFCADF